MKTLLAIALCAVCASGWVGAVAAPAAAPASAAPPLVNPLLPSGPDPWVTYQDGWYYFTCTTGKNLTLWKTRSIADLASAEKKVVWQPPAGMPYSHDLWAPELHFLRGKWYLYFAADAGTNTTHRIWVVENASADPLQGEWVLKGKLADTADRWAIDATVFENGSKAYAVWSGWEGAENGVQSLYIGELANPWTIQGQRTRISTPQFPWEKVGDIATRNEHGEAEKNPASDSQNPVHLDVNEGPEILQHDGKIFLVYSASACWTDNYALGMLTASANADLLDARSWSKAPVAQFWQSPQAHAYGTGHNGFFKSPDGTQDWIIYHANPDAKQGCGGQRSPRAQPITWNADGSPNFGRPVALGQPLPRPSGERP